MGQQEMLPINLADPGLLKKIDKLFASGVGEYISLPQLVVVGDQSSGKSSVLEGLTGLPFPRDSGLCTRFATQIVFRREKLERISVSILPSANSSEQHKDSVKAWSRSDLKKLTPSAFAKIMKEVQEVMGVGDKETAGIRGTFSEDVLRLEIYGPAQEHFSVVDVPGIFRKTTEGVTTNADKDLVMRMVRGYMASPRSILLAVVPANVDIATQEILTLAEEYDVEGIRTLGVLTKPDLVDSGSEDGVLGLLNGKRHALKLGWHIVRNPGQKQLQDPNFDRNGAETNFFASANPWNSLDKEKFGVQSLRQRLQEILASNIRREFPKVKAEIHKKLQAARHDLAKMGDKRDTATEQGRYLSDISMKFQNIVSSALSASYAGSNWFDEHKNLCFATAVVSRNEKLESVLTHHGHSYAFEGTNDDDMRDNRNKSGQIEDQTKEKKPSVIKVQYEESDVELDGLSSQPETIQEAHSHGVLAWLTKLYTESRGFELGTFDPSLLARAMKSQSFNWEPIAKGYISDIIFMAQRFIDELLCLVCPDARVREGLMSILMDQLQGKYQKAVKHVEFLLYVERQETPATVDHYFNDSLQKSRKDRTRKNIQHKVMKTEHGSVIRLEDIDYIKYMSNLEHVVQEIHDILKSYYKVARKRFTDNLCMQAANYHLVTGPESPLRLFSPSFVNRLSENQLAEIAGEDPVSRRRRGALNSEIEKLELAKKVLSG